MIELIRFLALVDPVLRVRVGGGGWFRKLFR